MIPVGYYPLCDIPNAAGKLLTVLLKNGNEIKTKVRRNNRTGFHTLIGVRVRDAIAWKPRNKD